MNLKKIIRTKAMPSFCTCNIFVLKSLLNFCKKKKLPVLIETTSNQVNQYGGYSEKKPKEFIRGMNNLANKVKFNKKKIFYGGDHLGPLPWKTSASSVALKKSIELVNTYIAAKYQKIHIDTSIECNGDKILTNKEVFLRTKHILEKLRNKKVLKKTFLVFGTEVPLAGGNNNKKIKSTIFKKIIDEYNNFSKLLKFENLPIKNFGLVIEPGMKFMHKNVTKPDLKNFKLKKLFSEKNNFFYEAHSTDYQNFITLRNLVKNNFKILKVGPELTFNLLKSFLFMEKVEKNISSEKSNFEKTILDQMFTSDQYWKNYFNNTSKKDIKKKIINSYYDRTRYYLNNKKVLDSIKVLESNINKIDNKQIIKLLTKKKKLYAIKYYNYKNFDLIISNYLNKIFIKYYKACGFNFSNNFFY
jgi:D-tagatose-1,6-bisphosphate aldolase subunit GatZ/KbaZ